MNELTNLDNPKSLLRQIIQGDIIITKGIIKLENMPIPKFEIPDEYAVYNILVRDKNIVTISNEYVTNIMNKTITKGYPANLNEGIMNALNNAYDHGNQKNGNRRIQLAYKITKTELDVIVSNEIGELNTDFLAFIIKLQNNKQSKQFIDYYEFSKRKKNPMHQGIGTYMIHKFFDEVKYYKGPLNGLAVHMKKSNPRYGR